MARLHADSVIRPNYVREVCRLLKTSNILLLKNDLEFEENQEAITKDYEERKKAGENNDLFAMEEEKRAQENQANASQPDKKVKITYDEYQRICVMIVDAVKEKERNEQSVTQSDIINEVVKRLEVDEGHGSSLERALQTSKKVANCIQHLITKEKCLLVTQDAKVKNERMLCMNINVEMTNMDLAGGK